MSGRTKRHGEGSFRRLPSGKWQVRMWDQAVHKRVSLGTYATKADANVALAVATTDRLRGGYVHPDRGLIALKEYARDWLDHHPTASPATRDLYEGLLGTHILPTLGQAGIGAIEPATVERWYSMLGRSTTAGQRAKSYRLLRAILNHAVKHERIVRNPCMIDSGGKESPAERPIATVPQVFALYEKFPEFLAVIVPVAAFASLRVGECAGMRRADVDIDGRRLHIRRQVKRLEDGTLHVKAPKSDSARAVSLPEQVMDLLADHMDRYTGPKAEDYVFTRPHGTPVDRLYVGRHWRSARKHVAAEDSTLPADLHFHDLRGTGATLATAQGASLKQVMLRLGHSTSRAALLYQHATSDGDAAIASLLGEAIDKAQSGEKVAEHG